MGHDSEYVRADGSQFSIKEFIRLVNTANPKYILLFLGVILLGISSGVQIYIPKMASSLVNNFSDGVDYHLLMKVVILSLISALVSAIGGTILGIFGENVIQNLRKHLWEKLVSLRVRYFDTVKAGETSSRLVNDTSQVKQLLATTFPQTLASLILMGGSIVMMVRVDWQMSLAMLVIVPLLMLVMVPILRFGTKIGHLRQDALAKFNGIVNEILSEIRLVKTSNAEKQAKEKANQEIDDLYKVGKKEAVFDAVMQPIMMMLMMSVIFGLLAYGMHRIAIGTMAIGTLMSFIMYLFNLLGSIPSIATLFSELAKVSGSTKRVHELLNEEIEMFTCGDVVELEGKELEVKNVYFSYEEETILQDISFSAQPNQVIAFAGPSGGGKSTIFSLLERFYEPDEGAIYFDSQNINQMALGHYRSQVGYVSQDSVIMAGTIRENLTFGLDGYFGDEALWHVLELAYAKKFVEEMPNGLNTEVGERGVKISGGQRQRISIARAFLRNPKVLMLDEATASLDSESEMMVQKALNYLMEGRTTLVIAHRLVTIVDSDKIYFIEKGKITGEGRHEELIKTHKMYANYVNEQSLGQQLIA